MEVLFIGLKIIKNYLVHLALSFFFFSLSFFFFFFWNLELVDLAHIPCIK